MSAVSVGDLGKAVLETVETAAKARLGERSGLFLAMLTELAQSGLDALIAEALTTRFEAGSIVFRDET